MRRTIATAAITCFAIAAAAAPAMGATIGFVYTGSDSGTTATTLQRFAVSDTGELTLAGDTPVSNRYVFGVALAQIPSGTYLYVMDAPSNATTEPTIDELRVNTADGTLAPIGSIKAPHICVEHGQRLWVFDEGSPSTARLFSEYCNEAIPETGIRQFDIAEATGLLEDVGQYPIAGWKSFAGMDVSGAQIGVAGNNTKQTQLEFVDVMPATGVLNFLGAGKSFGLNDGGGEAGNQHGSEVAVGHGLFSIGNVTPFSQTEPSGVGILTLPFGGGGSSSLLQLAHVDALGYTRSALIAGEHGPQLEIFAAGQSAPGSQLIHLGEPPTSLGSGDFIETVYSLGPFVYLGVYGSRVVQLLDAAGSPVHLMSTPFASPAEGVDASVTSIAGFLSGTPSGGPGPGGPGSGGPGSGGPGGGGQSGASSSPSGTTSKAGPQPIGLSGAATSKLKSGGLKVKVTCGLPCTIAGAVVPPGAKFARRARPLPFKSVRLPGGGKPVTVTLRFTHAQLLYATAQLRRRRTVSAVVQVSESPGGAAPRRITIRIT